MYLRQHRAKRVQQRKHVWRRFVCVLYAILTLVAVAGMATTRGFSLRVLAGHFYMAGMIKPTIMMYSTMAANGALYLQTRTRRGGSNKIERGGRWRQRRLQ